MVSMTDAARFHVMKDPVHGTMQFTTVEDRWIKPFIDSPHFQRLRHIKQLGMSDFVFPGAVHTRFNHSLGCCYVASQIANKIGLSETEKQLVMISGLLHDMGHGPFSHAFENLFHEQYIRHEDWTPLFLKEYNHPDFFEEYNKKNPNHPLSQEKFDLIQDMIMHKTKGSRLLADIVSSQLDADRLDYLLRDSHFCGVSYGKFDLRWILHCLCIVKTTKGDRLGITYKGIGSIEQYLMARRLMLRNIYHHKKALMMQYYLIQLLTQLSMDVDHLPLFRDIKESKLSIFLLKIRDFNQKIKTSHRIEKDKKDFLTNNVALFKELYDYDIYAVIRYLSGLDSDHDTVALAKRIQQRKMPMTFKLNNHSLSLIETEISAIKNVKKELKEWQLAILKMPHQFYTSGADPILVWDEWRGVMPLHELSPTIDAISDTQENTAILGIDPAIYDLPIIQKLVANLKCRVD